VSASKFS